MLGYIAALPLLYVFVYLPISNSYFRTSPSPQGHVAILNSSLIADDLPLSCPQHSYNTHILSQEPLIVYIESFLSSDESKHLIEISEDKFAPSTVSTGAETSIQKDIRHSEVALIDRDDVVRCIEHRARDFQGWRPDIHIERLRTQRYGEGGHYVHHYDWSGASREADRVSTFMVYVDAQCEGGGTEFPRLPMPDARKGRWCEFLECEEKNDEREEEKTKMGITFKPIKGNAVYWENMRPDGRGYEETWHAGLPVKSGSKIGLNIWSWGRPRRR
ncbi:hypothetical protein BDZ45DRAFT_237363 [Acephala macrosclerotiorum]|nr:hypothetical protein BDZ45DRAFT_237363 [Acephala macrosclerotiorum]